MVITQPQITPVNCTKKGFAHKQCYRNDADFKTQFFWNDFLVEYEIPKGFIYDGASIPWFLWSIIRVTPDGLHRAATILHDALYIAKGKVAVLYLRRNEELNITLSRKEVDQIFLQQMLFLGMPEKKAKLMYRGVRIFGRFINNF